MFEVVKNEALYENTILKKIIYLIAHKCIHPILMTCVKKHAIMVIAFGKMV